MRIAVYRKLPIMIRLTTKSPGKHSVDSLAKRTGLSVSTIWKYAKQFKLPVKKKPGYSESQKEFVRTHAAVMTNAEISKALGLKPYQVQDIGKKLRVDFMIKIKKREVESEFFVHDKYYCFSW